MDNYDYTQAGPTGQSGSRPELKSGAVAANDRSVFNGEMRQANNWRRRTSRRHRSAALGFRWGKLV